MYNSEFSILGLALGLGLLVGIQRERSDSKIAGIRTFALITLTGALSGIIGRQYDNLLIIVGGLFAIALFMFSANLLKSKSNQIDTGQTTEVAALLMYLIGAYLVFGNKSIAVALGAVVALLLHLKERLSTLIERMEPKDMRAIMQFVAISLVVLPILPNKTYGPYNVLNPFNVWLMVTLIVGIGVTGYFIYKWLGSGIGTISNGILGGLVSSTASTATYARMSTGTRNMEWMAIFIILCASMVAFIRVIFEVAIVIPDKLGQIAPPLVAVTFFTGVVCTLIYYFKQRGKERQNIPDLENPAQLKSALVFGFLYALITLLVAIAKDRFGNSGLYIVSVISGLTDVDAITLSLSNQIKDGGLTTSSGWQLILLAALSNLVFKGGLAISIGSKKLRKLILTPFIIVLIFGVLVFFFWPEGWML